MQTDKLTEIVELAYYRKYGRSRKTWTVIVGILCFLLVLAVADAYHYYFTPKTSIFILWNTNILIQVKTGEEMRIDVTLKDESKPVSADNLQLKYYTKHGEDWHQHPGSYFTKGNKEEAKKEFLKLYQ